MKPDGTRGRDGGAGTTGGDDELLAAAKRDGEERRNYGQSGERRKMRRCEQPRQERRISDKARRLYLTVNTRMSD